MNSVTEPIFNVQPGQKLYCDADMCGDEIFPQHLMEYRCRHRYHIFCAKRFPKLCQDCINPDRVDQQRLAEFSSLQDVHPDMSMEYYYRNGVPGEGKKKKKKKKKQKAIN